MIVKRASVFVSPLLFGTFHGFTITPISTRLKATHFLDETKCHTCLDLVPIRNFRSDITFLDESFDNKRCCFDKDGRMVLADFEDDDGEVYELCVAQEEDLPDVARFVVDTFGADIISMSTDLDGFSKALMEPTVGLLNAYSGLVAYTEVLSGLQTRTKDRNDDVAPPLLTGKDREEKLQQAARSSLLLAVGRASKGSDWRIDVVASVELRLEPCDAKIPFSLPWLDRIERRLAGLIGMKDHAARDLQPYLSNLCVDEKYRRKQLGKALVRCVEDICTKSWGYSKLYLHVDLENEAALKLYSNEGYRDVGKRWNPFWAGSAAEIGYFVKRFGKKKSKSVEAAKSTQKQKKPSLR